MGVIINNSPSTANQLGSLIGMLLGNKYAQNQQADALQSVIDDYNTNHGAKTMDASKEGAGLQKAITNNVMPPTVFPINTESGTQQPMAPTTSMKNAGFFNNVARVNPTLITNDTSVPQIATPSAQISPTGLTTDNPTPTSADSPQADQGLLGGLLGGSTLATPSQPSTAASLTPHAPQLVDLSQFSKSHPETVDLSNYSKANNPVTEVPATQMSVPQQLALMTKGVKAGLKPDYALNVVQLLNNGQTSDAQKQLLAAAKKQFNADYTAANGDPQKIQDALVRHAIASDNINQIPATINAFKSNAEYGVTPSGQMYNKRTGQVQSGTANLAKPDKPYASAGSGVVYDTNTGQPVYVKPNSGGKGSAGGNNTRNPYASYERNGFYQDSNLYQEYLDKVNNQDLISDQDQRKYDNAAARLNGYYAKTGQVIPGATDNTATNNSSEPVTDTTAANAQQTDQPLTPQSLEASQKAANAAWYDQQFRAIKEAHPDALDEDITNFLTQKIQQSGG